MGTINNKLDLEKEIYRLKLEVKQKEEAIQKRFDELSDDLEPGALLNAGIKSFFHKQTKNKTIVTTGLTILAGFLVERVILRKSNILVKYGIAQIAMALVTKLSEENWHPEIFSKIKNALQQAISNEVNTEEQESDENRMNA
jgi:DNA-directed RNA polymerase beta' subunit